MGPAGDWMHAIDRYIIRTTLSAFLVVLVTLTAFIWVTQALREIDLITNQGQTILVFVGMTGLLIPVLVLIIAPLALVIAAVHVLNKLNTDSEIVVMNAAGLSPARLFVPFVLVAVLVSILVGAISVYVAPKGLRELRSWAAKVRADLVTNLVQPGRFTTIENGLTIHIRERRADGRLAGIFIDDRRNPKERATLIAEQGEIVESAKGTFLVMGSGSIQRQEAGARDPAIVIFDRNVFDLSQFTAAASADTRSVSFRERYLWELISPDPRDPRVRAQSGQLRAELNDRIVTPLYPIAFVVIAYAFLGIPATARQTRNVLLGMTVTAVIGLRLAGFGLIIFSAQTAAALVLLYATIFTTIGLGGFAIWRGKGLQPPMAPVQAIDAVARRLARRKVPA